MRLRLLRPKIIGLRLRQAFMFAFVAGLAAAAIWTVKESFRAGLFSRASSGAPRWSAPSCVEGLGDPLKSEVLAFAKDRLAVLPPAQARAAWRESFPYLKRADAPAWRRLFGASPCWRLRLRGALGRLARSRKGAWFLGREGESFEGPDSLYAGQDLPVIDAPESSPADLAALAAFLSRLAVGDVRPRALSRLAAGKGWRLEMPDGLSVLWGDLDYFAEKQKRLAQVLADLQKRGESPEAIDLRFVGAGRVFVKGLAARSGGERRELGRS